MRRFFGAGAKAAPAPSLEDAVTKVDGRADTLGEKIRKLEQEAGRYQQQMKKMRPGAGRNALKNKALAVLRRKKMYEKQQEQLIAQSFNMEQASFGIEQMKDTVSTVNAMKAASKTLKGQLGKLNIDKIDDIQDEMADLLEQSNEIQSVLAEGYDIPDDVDEAALEDELEALGDEMELYDANEADMVPSYLQPANTEQIGAGLDEFGLPAAAAPEEDKVPEMGQ